MNERKHLLDGDAQPDPSFNSDRRIGRGNSELIGFVRGILADGHLSGQEVLALERWFKANPDLWHEFPCNLLLTRLLKATADGHVDEDEIRDISEMLTLLIGEQSGSVEGASMATALPLDNPEPPLVFQDRGFVLTGKFAYGPRSVCEEAIAGRGGVCLSAISKKTNILVIGTLGSRDWRESTHGRKIEKAVEYRDNGIPLVIVCENHWVSHLE